MRTIITVILVLLVAAFAVAQDTTNPGAASSQAPGQMQQPGTTPGQRPGTPDQAAPSSPMDRAPASAGDMIEGCLGGSNPNYTVTDKSGKTYQILIPQGADASPLAKHIGESIQVEGTVDKAAKSDSAVAPDSSAAPGASPGAAASSSRSIHAVRIGRGTGTCPAGSSTTQKPPSK